MTGLVSHVYLAILLGWVGFAITASVPIAVFVAVIVVIFNRTSPIRGIMAFLDPIGIVLPLLALRHTAPSFGYELPTYSRSMLVLILALYLGFLATSLGLVRVNIYRFGYRAVGVAIMVGCALLFGLIFQDPFIPCVAVLGQVLWAARIGSSNFFDHVTHAALIPIILTSLVASLFS